MRPGICYYTSIRPAVAFVLLSCFCCIQSERLIGQNQLHDFELGTAGAATVPTTNGVVFEATINRFLLIFFNTVCARPVNQDDAITLTLRVANYKDAPVQLVGLKHADEAGSEPYVHFRNVSSVKTSRVWVEAVVSSPDSGGKILSRMNSNVPNQRWPAERMIEPGADVWAHETALRSDSLVIHDKEVQTKCLFVTI